MGTSSRSKPFRRGARQDVNRLRRWKKWRVNRPFTEGGGNVRSLEEVENGREERVEMQSVGRGAFSGKCGVQRVKYGIFYTKHHCV